MRNLTPLGHARVFRHPVTGELVVDTDSLRRTHFAGADDFGGWDDDQLIGEAGNDRLFGDVGNDDLFGGDGLDLLLGENDDERSRAVTAWLAGSSADPD